MVLIVGFIVVPRWVLAASDSPADERATTYRKDAEALIKQGAYHDALEVIQTWLALQPQDPQAELYRSLCEVRLGSPTQFQQLNQAESNQLKAKLQDEERAQRRSAAMAKALERQFQREQQAWDRQVAESERQAQRDQQRQHQIQRQPSRAQPALAAPESHRPPAAESHRVEPSRPASASPVTPSHQPSPEKPSASPASPSVSEQPEPAPANVSTPTTPSSAPSPTGRSAAAPSVELAPVIVATRTQTQQTVTPSLAHAATAQPGVVEIRAEQMTMSPERRLALAQGSVEVVYDDVFMTCDKLTLFTDTKDLYAEGHVRIEQGQNVFRGDMAHYNPVTKKGRFLQGTITSPPWHEHGRTVEDIAEGVYEVTPGYLTSCELEPPHFQFRGSRALIFADERIARVRNMTLVVDQLPLIYLPWMTMADRQTPFFIVPGKKKPWGQFALMGYRYELPTLFGVEAKQKGALRLDWRRYFGWAVGVDHQLESPTLGNGLLKVYYNEEQNMTRPKETLPKGAAQKRYRVLWRHQLKLYPDTRVVTDFQKYSDQDFRKELLFREEYVNDDTTPETFVSLVKSNQDFTVTGEALKRVNRFMGQNEGVVLNVSSTSRRIADTNFYNSSSAGFASLNAKGAHTEVDTDIVRADWSQGFSYAMSLLRPIELTPRATVQQAFYTKDKQGGAERPQGQRNLFSGQFSTGADASLKLFRLFSTTTNVMGLNINRLRHVVTPTVAYNYIHRPTVANDLLSFPLAATTTNEAKLGLENKLQTKRLVAKSWRSVDLARFLISAPYTFRGTTNKQGGRYGDWKFDLETFPWPWMRLETDWTVLSHFMPGVQEERIPAWNVDMVIVGGRGDPLAEHAADIQAPRHLEFQAEPEAAVDFLLPQGQWYLGLRRAYGNNSKTEDVLQWDWRLSDKWELGTFQRFTEKEVARGGAKRFANLREFQYRLRRDLHDWIGEFVYRVDREFGEELFFLLTLKAYPDMPLGTGKSYHQPKIDSQDSPFSPLARPH